MPCDAGVGGLRLALEPAALRVGRYVRNGPAALGTNGASPAPRGDPPCTHHDINVQVGSHIVPERGGAECRGSKLGARNSADGS